MSPAARKKNELMPVAKVEAEAASRILTVRGQRVVLDSDLAEFYDVETKALNRQVRSNQARFPEDFVFQLTREEFSRVLRCRNRTSNDPRGGPRYRSLVFTELGALAVSGVLKSERAAEVSVAVARAFVAMRGQLAELASHPVLVDVVARLAKLEKHSTQQTEFNRLMRDAMRDFVHRASRGPAPRSALRRAYRRPPFAWLQRAHRICRFSTVEAPPMVKGMMWSYWMSKSLPHSTQRPPSRLNTASFTSLDMGSR